MAPSPIDLSEVYGELASLLPKREDEEIALSRVNIPEPPGELATTRFWSSVDPRGGTRRTPRAPANSTSLSDEPVLRVE